MKAMNISPRTIYIDNRAEDYPLTRSLCAHFSDVPRKIIYDSKEFIKDFNKRTNAIQEGKNTFFITVNKGAFLKKCPGTAHYICCGYQILFPSSQCSLDCSYCILQSYFNNPLITFFANTGDMLDEVAGKLSRDRSTLWRVGTGEYTDSLVFDSFTGLTKELVPFFSRQSNAILELKTKTDTIENLLSLDPRGRIVVAWSLNARRIVRKEEKYSASVSARLKAAALCARNGYKIAFHFDPLFYYPGWEDEYRKVVDRIFHHVSPDDIVWISLGCFRSMPSLFPVIAERFPESTYIYNEFITGLDGKKRYPKPIRIHQYSKMYQWLKEHNSNIFIYLCMESRDVWRKALGVTPSEFHGLKQGLDSRVF